MGRAAAVKYAYQFVSRAALDTYKQRTGPDGEKPNWEGRVRSNLSG